MGYRWFANRSDMPLFAFGYGLTYTTFDHTDLEVTGGDTITATFTVTNTGDRDGRTCPRCTWWRLRDTRAPGRSVSNGCSWHPGSTAGSP